MKKKNTLPESRKREHGVSPSSNVKQRTRRRTRLLRKSRISLESQPLRRGESGHRNWGIRKRIGEEGKAISLFIGGGEREGKSMLPKDNKREGGTQEKKRFSIVHQKRE